MIQHGNDETEKENKLKKSKLNATINSRNIESRFEMDVKGSKSLVQKNDFTVLT